MTKFEKPGTQGVGLPRHGRSEAGDEGARRRRASPTTRSSRPSSATATATRPAASARVYELGLTGIPVVNVNNNCSTGSSALYPRAPGRQRRPRRLRARARLREDGARARSASKYTDRTHPMDKHVDGDGRAARVRRPRRPRRRCSATPAASTWSATAPTPEHFAWIGWKNHKHSVNNPYAQFQDEYTLEEIKRRQDDPRAADQAAVLARPPTAPAAAIVASERFVDEHGLWDQAVEIAGQAMVDRHAQHVRRAAAASSSSATT